MRRNLIWLALASGVAGCGSNSVGTSGPCDVNPPDPACDITCNGDDGACPTGFYCSTSGTCSADCTQGGDECGEGFTCDPRGRCQRDGGGGGGDGGMGNGDGNDCPSVTVTPMPQIPTVQLLLDRSGSMDATFGGGLNRWQAVRAALTGASGVVTQLENRVYFGATTYSSDRAGTCPDVVSTPTRAFGNRAAIDTLLRANLLTDTPTGESMRLVVDGFVASPPPMGSSPIIVLATDGLPDTCANVDENGNTVAQNLTVTEVQRAYGMGIKTYILSVGNQVGAAHLQRVANAGVGLDPATGTAPYYTANDPSQLATQLQQIISGALSCDFDLTGTVSDTTQAGGTVTLGGMPLMFGTDWTFVDNNTIRLTGAACDTFRTGGQTLSATFDCGVIVN